MAYITSVCSYSKGLNSIIVKHITVKDAGKCSPAVFPGGGGGHWQIASQSWPFYGILIET